MWLVNRPQTAPAQLPNLANPSKGTRRSSHSSRVAVIFNLIFCEQEYSEYLRNNIFEAPEYPQPGSCQIILAAVFRAGRISEIFIWNIFGAAPPSPFNLDYLQPWSTSSRLVEHGDPAHANSSAQVPAARRDDRPAVRGRTIGRKHQFSMRVPHDLYIVTPINARNGRMGDWRICFQLDWCLQSLLTAQTRMKRALVGLFAMFASSKGPFP